MTGSSAEKFPALHMPEPDLQIYLAGLVVAVSALALGSLYTSS
jgi:hypothetical protein